MVEDFSTQSNVLYLHTRIDPISLWHPIYCDRTHEWRATSSRARDFRNSRKRYL